MYIFKNVQEQMHRGKLSILQVLSCPKLSTVPMFLALQHESIRVHREMTRKNVLEKFKDKEKQQITEKKKNEQNFSTSIYSVEVCVLRVMVR